jgi:hypothetical protein
MADVARAGWCVAAAAMHPPMVAATPADARTMTAILLRMGPSWPAASGVTARGVHE